jgi:hypothetical protein
MTVSQTAVLGRDYKFNAPRRTLPRKLCKHRMPVVLKIPQWSIAVHDKGVQYWAHSSAEDHKEFLHNKLADMVQAHHRLVLPYTPVLQTTDLQISPLGLVSQQDYQPGPTIAYTFSSKTSPTRIYTV